MIARPLKIATLMSILTLANVAATTAQDKPAPKPTPLRVQVVTEPGNVVGSLLLRADQLGDQHLHRPPLDIPPRLDASPDAHRLSLEPLRCIANR